MKKNADARRRDLSPLFYSDLASVFKLYVPTPRGMLSGGLLLLVFLPRLLAWLQEPLSREAEELHTVRGVHGLRPLARQVWLLGASQLLLRTCCERLV